MALPAPVDGPPAEPAEPGLPAEPAEPGLPAEPGVPAEPATAEAPRETFREAPAERSLPLAEQQQAGTRPAPRTARPRGVRLAGPVLALVLAAGVVVLAARGVTTLPGVPEFLQRYPGSSEPPDTVEPGFPGWVRWTHFLNAFFMILIIRTGWQVRTQQKPPAYWSSRRSGRRFSLTLWAHLLVDALWLLNGVAFVVLLFASGRWARIVPTSWDALPNAASALLQYLTLEWPVEDGWANYNSLQQIMYFLVVFVAAPLALLTGLRMSAWWPRRFESLGRVFPVEAARVLHFLTMSFFVVFIVVHVFLVFATGALRNLNHMFWGADSPGWAGFIWFAMAVLATAGAVAAMRPVLIAPLAGRFGTVSTK